MEKTASSNSRSASPAAHGEHTGEVQTNWPLTVEVKKENFEKSTSVSNKSCVGREGKTDSTGDDTADCMPRFASFKFLTSSNMQERIDQRLRTKEESVEEMPVSLAGALDAVRPVSPPPESLGDHLRGEAEPVDVESWLVRSERACREARTDHNTVENDTVEQPRFGSPVPAFLERNSGDPTAVNAHEDEVYSACGALGSVKKLEHFHSDGEKYEEDMDGDVSKWPRIMVNSTKVGHSSTPPPPNPLMDCWLKVCTLLFSYECY